MPIKTALISVPAVRYEIRMNIVSIFLQANLHCTCFLSGVPGFRLKAGVFTTSRRFDGRKQQIPQLSFPLCFCSFAAAEPYWFTGAI